MGTSTVSWNPPPARSSVDSWPPSGSIRSRNPRKPWPGSRVSEPRPSSRTVRRRWPSLVAMPIVHRVALLCRRTLVAPSRTAQARAASGGWGKLERDELTLKDHGRERLAQFIVKITRQPEPLFVHGQPADFISRQLKLNEVRDVTTDPDCAQPEQDHHHDNIGGDRHVPS